MATTRRIGFIGIGLVFSVVAAAPDLAGAQVTGPPGGGGGSTASPTPGPSLSGASTPPAFVSKDELGIDFGQGDIQYSLPLVSIGAQGTHSLSATYQNLPGTDENTGAIDYNGDPYMGVMSYRVSVGNSTEIFTTSGSTYVSTQGTGSTLTFDAVSNTWTYTKNDGTVAVYAKSMAGQLQIPSNQGVLTSVTFPTGEKFTYYYKTFSGPYVRLRSVVSNRGLMLKYTGQADTTAGLRVTAVNLAVDYCDPNADACTGTSQSWPSAFLANPTSTSNTVGSTNYYALTRLTTNPAGKVSKRIYNQNVTFYGSQTKTSNIVNVVDETNRTETVAYYDIWTQESAPNINEGRVNSAVFGSTLSRSYSWSGAGPINHPFFTGGGSLGAGTNGASTGAAMKLNSAYVEQVAVTQALVQGVTTSYKRDSYGRVYEIDRSDGDYDVYTYDGRGNVTQINHKPRTGFSDADIVYKATYPTTCTNYKSCNKPTATFDAKNNETDYTYDGNGLLLTRTDPADSNGLRAVTTYTYTGKYAQIKTAGGGTANADSQIYVLTKVTTCATGPGCLSGSTDERVTTYDYNNNLYASVLTVSGNGLSATTTTTYDRMGDVAAVDGPRTDVDDIAYTTRDIMRRPVYEIGPDPDGTGPLQRKMIHHVYDDAGHETSTETGIGTSTDGSGFVRKSYVQTTYNDAGLKSRTATYIDGNATPQAVTDYSYDPSGRNLCTAVRMNMASVGSSPVDACTLTTAGSYGPDRITKNQYNSGSQVTEVDQAVGTTIQRAYARYAYTGDGLKQSETDANGNKTTLVYDAFNRLSQVQYPSSSIGSGSSNTGDYEAYAYDPNGNRSWWRHRDNRYTYYNYDNLNREILHYVSDGSIANIYTGYDLLGHVLYRRFGSTSGTGTSYSYDGLGRLSSTTDMNSKTVGYQYNQASARTQLTYPSGLYVTYALDSLNRVNNALLSNGRQLYAIAYDNLGNRRKLNRVNTIGAGEDPSACVTNTDATCYGYDALGRLTSLSDDFNNTDHDVTWTFGGYNPAGQLTSVSASTNIFDYKETSNAIDNPSYDGLNRDARLVPPTGVCGSGGYDSRGNMICDGLTSRSFTYDVDNRLTGGVGYGNSVGLAYDPEGRLSSYTVNGGVTTFLYDDTNLIGEYPASGATQQYYYGPGTDEPIVAFDSQNYNLLWDDYHGSIIGLSSDGGTLADANLYRYSPYGEPRNASNGDGWAGTRFRYTGQAALPELKVYFYKARGYDPLYGRFLQTDPIGTKDDLDLYAYVAGDPINRADPTGNEAGCVSNNGTCGVGNNPNAAPGTTVIITGGGQGNLAAGGVGGHASVQGGVAIDNQGTVKPVVTGSAGPEAGAKTGGGPVVSVTIANGHVNDQRGTSTGATVSGGAVSVGGSHGTNTNGQDVNAVTVSVSPGVGGSVSQDNNKTIVVDTPKQAPGQSTAGAPKMVSCIPSVGCVR